MLFYFVAPVLPALASSLALQHNFPNLNPFIHPFHHVRSSGRKCWRPPGLPFRLLFPRWSLTLVAMATPFSHRLISTSTWERGKAWHMGINSEVRLAAMIPARRATSSGSPLGFFAALETAGGMRTNALASASRRVGLCRRHRPYGRGRLRRNERVSSPCRSSILHGRRGAPRLKPLLILGALGHR